MGQRGPKSTAEIITAFPRSNGKPSRLTPPAHLSKAARAIFTEIVAATVDERHFRASDIPVLASYCMATQATRDAEDFNEFEKAARLQASLAVRLRLTPSSRIHHRVAGRFKEPNDGPQPWDDVS